MVDMLEYWDKRFKYSDEIALNPQLTIYLNYFPRVDNFLIDYRHTDYYWEHLIVDIKPVNKQKWLFALQQLLGRIYQKW